jgi:hypothetical protein
MQLEMHVTVKQHAFAKHIGLFKIDCFNRVKGAGLQLNLEKCGGQTRKGAVFKTESPFRQTEDVILNRRNQF